MESSDSCQPDTDLSRRFAEVSHAPIFSGESSLTPFRSALCLPLPACEDTDTCSLFSPSLLDACSQADVTSDPPRRGEVQLQEQSCCESVASHFCRPSLATEGCLQRSPTSLFSSSFSSACLKTSSHECSAYISTSAIVSQATVGGSVASNQELGPGKPVDRFIERGDSCGTDAPAGMDTEHWKLSNQAMLTAKFPSPQTTVAPLQDASPNVPSKRLAACVDVARRERRPVSLPSSQEEIQDEHCDCLSQKTTTVQCKGLPPENSGLFVSTRQNSKSGAEKNKWGEWSPEGRTRAAWGSADAPSSLKTAVATRKPFREHLHSKLSSSPCAWSTEEQAAAKVAALLDSSTSTSGATAMLPRGATGTTLVVHQQTRLKHPKTAMAREARGMQVHNCGWASSQMAFNPHEYRKSLDKRKTVESIIALPSLPFAQGGSVQIPFQSNCARENVETKVTASSSNVHCATLPSYVYSARLTPTATHGTPADPARNIVAHKDLLRIVDGIAAFGLATERAERLAARASREAAVAAHAATRAATAVADLLGVPSHKLFKNVFHSPIEKVPAVHLRSPGASDAFANTDSVAAQTVARRPGDEEETPSSGDLDVSPLPLSLSFTDVCTPVKQSPLVHSSQHPSLLSEGRTVLVVSSPEKNLRTCALPAQKSGRRCESWTSTVSDSPDPEETTTLGEGCLQASSRVRPRSDAEQRKRQCVVHCTHHLQNSCTDIDRGPGAITCQTSGGKPSALPFSNGNKQVSAVDTWYGTQVVTQEDFSFLPNHTQWSVLMSQKQTAPPMRPAISRDASVLPHHWERVFFHPQQRRAGRSRISFTQDRQPRSLRRNAVATLAKNDSEASVGSMPLEAFAGELNSKALPTNERATGRSNVLCVAEQSRKTNQATLSKGLVSATEARRPSEAISAQGSCLFSPRRRRASVAMADTVDGVSTVDSVNAGKSRDPTDEGGCARKAACAHTQAPQDGPHLCDRPFVELSAFETHTPARPAQKICYGTKGYIISTGKKEREENEEQKKRTASHAHEELHTELKMLTCDGRTVFPLSKSGLNESDHGMSLPQLASHNSQDPIYGKADHCDAFVGDRLYNALSADRFTRHTDTAGRQEEGVLQLRKETCRCAPPFVDQLQRKTSGCAGFCGHQDISRHSAIRHARRGVQHEKKYSRLNTGALLPYRRNPRAPFWETSACAPCYDLHSGRKRTAHTWERQVGGRSDTDCDVRTQDVPPKKFEINSGETMRVTFSELSASKSRKDTRMNRAVGSLFGPSNSKYTCGHTEICGDGGKSTQCPCGSSPPLDGLQPRFLSIKDISEAYLEDSVRREIRDEHGERQLDEPCSDSGSFSRGSSTDSSSSKQIFLQKAVDSSSLSRNQSNASEAILNKNSVREKMTTTGEERGCTAEKTTSTGFGGLLPTAQQKGASGAILPPFVAPEHLRVAVKEEMLHASCDSFINLSNTAASESVGRCEDRTSRFGNANTKHSKAQVQGGQVEGKPVVQNLLLKTAAANSGIDGRSTNELHIDVRYNPRDTSSEYSANIQTSRRVNPGSISTGSTKQWGIFSNLVSSSGRHDTQPCAVYIPTSNGTSRCSPLAGVTHAERDASLWARTEDDRRLDENRGYHTSLQQLYQHALTGKSPKRTAVVARDSGINADNFDVAHIKGEKAQQKETAGFIDDQEGDASVANTTEDSSEEKHCNFVSNIPGVSYRAAPHCGWRFRWKDHESGKEYSRCFSVNKFGFHEAKWQAESVAMEIRKKLTAKKRTRWKTPCKCGRHFSWKDYSRMSSKDAVYVEVRMVGAAAKSTLS